MNESTCSCFFTMLFNCITPTEKTNDVLFQMSNVKHKDVSSIAYFSPKKSTADGCEFCYLESIQYKIGGLKTGE